MRFDWISLCFLSLVIVGALLLRIYRYQLSSVDMALTLTYSITVMGFFQYTIRFEQVKDRCWRQFILPLKAIGRSGNTDDIRRTCSRVL